MFMHIRSTPIKFSYNYSIIVIINLIIIIQVMMWPNFCPFMLGINNICFFWKHIQQNPPRGGRIAGVLLYLVYE